MDQRTGRVVGALLGIIIVAIAATLQQSKALGLTDQAGAILVIATAVLTAAVNALPSVFGVEVAPPAPKT